MGTRMTTAAWVQGIKNAAICGIGMLVILVPASYVMASSSHRSPLESMVLLAGITVGTTFVLLLVRFVYAMKSSAPTLLDCGPRPWRWGFVVAAGIFAFNGIFFAAFPSERLHSLAHLAPLAYVGAAAFYAFMALGRFQIKENGLWLYIDLLTWDKIESWQWEGDEHPTLLIRTKTRFGLLGHSALPIPIEHRAAVERLLREHCT